MEDGVNEEILLLIHLLDILVISRRLFEIIMEGKVTTSRLIPFWIDNETLYW